MKQQGFYTYWAR